VRSIIFDDTRCDTKSVFNFICGLRIYVPLLNKVFIYLFL